MKSRNWIFLRGLGRSSIHWSPFIKEFQKLFPQDEVELLDLRGNGSLSHSPSYLNVSENVRDLRARSRWIQEKKPVHLMTISLGSMIGVEWAHLFPQEVAGIVTMNTSDRSTSSFYERMKPMNYLMLLQYFRKPQASAWVEDHVLKSTVNNLKDKENLLAEFSQVPLTSRSNFLRQLIAAGTYHFPEQKPKTEILMLCSDGDQLVSSECSKKVAQMWTLKPHIHPTAGHDLPMEDPTWVCEQVLNWLNFQGTEEVALKFK